MSTALLIFVDETPDFLAEGISLETAGGPSSSHQPLKIKPFIGITFTFDGIYNSVAMRIQSCSLTSH